MALEKIGLEPQAQGSYALAQGGTAQFDVFLGCIEFIGIRRVCVGVM